MLGGTVCVTGNELESSHAVAASRPIVVVKEGARSPRKRSFRTRLEKWLHSRLQRGLCSHSRSHSCTLVAFPFQLRYFPREQGLRQVAGYLPGVSRAIWIAPREAEHRRRACAIRTP